MYLRAAKTEAEEAGVETEGMANSVSSLRGELKSLTGVDIMLDDSTFKSTYQILKEISGIWDSLSDISRSNVLNLLGGKRNANVISSLITNFKDAEAAMESAMNSMGSAAVENEKYLDSINGGIALFKASFEELSMAVIDSDLVKFVVDFGTAILNALTQVATFMEKLGGLKTALIAVAGTLVILKGNMIALMVTQTVVTLFTKVRSAISNIIGIIPNAITAWRAYSAGIVSANTAMQASIPVIGLVLAAISAVVAGVSYFSSKQEKASQKLIEEANEITAAYSEASDEYKSNVKTLKSLEDEFNRLSDGVDSNGNRVSLTASQYERYKDIVDQIIGISPSVCAGYDNEGKAIVNYSNLISEAIEKQDEYLDKQREIHLGNRDTIFEGAQNELKDVRKEATSAVGRIGWAFYDLRQDIYGKWSSASDLDSLLKEFGDSYGIKGLEALNTQSGSMSDAMYEVAMKLYEHRSEFMAYLSTKIDEDGETYDKINQGILALAGMPQKLSESTAGWREYIDTWIRYATDGSGNPINDWFSEIPVSAMTAFNDRLDSLCAGFVLLNISAKQAQDQVAQYGQEFVNTLASDGAQDILNMAVSMANGAVTVTDYNAAVAEYLETLEEGSLIVSLMSDYLYGLTDSATSDAEAVEQATKAYTGLTDALKRLSDGYSILETAEKEMADGSLSLDTVKKIADSLDENELLTDYVYEESGALKLNTDAWAQRSKAIAAADKEYLKRQKTELEYLKEQNELVKQYEGQSYEQILDSNGKDTADSVKAARKYVSGHVAELATLDEQLAYTTGMIGIYDIALKEAGSSDDPLNLSSMISDLDSVGSKAKGLVSALAELENGAAMSKGEISALALQYEELFGVSPDFDLTTLEGQKSAIEEVIGALKAEYDAIIDTQIAALKARRDSWDSGLTKEEVAAIDTKISRLEQLKSLSLAALYGEDNKAKTTTKRYSELSDAISSVSKAQKLLTDIGSGESDPISTLQSVIEILQDTKDLNIEDFISGFSDTEGIQWNEKAIRAWSDSMVRAIPGIDELDARFPGLKQHMMDMAAAQVEAANEAEKLRDAFSNLSKAVSFVTNLHDSGSDPLDLIQSAIEMASLVEGTDWTSWVSGFDAATGAFTWSEEAIRSFTDSMVESIPNLAGLEAQFPGITAYLKETAFAAEEAAVSYEALSDAMNGISKVSDFMVGVRTGSTDTLSMLQAAIDMAEQSKQDISDFFTIVNGDFVWNEAGVNAWLAALIDKIKDLPGVTDEVVTAIRGMAQAEIDASSASEALSQAINGVKTASSLLTDIKSGEGNFIDMLQTVSEMAQQSGQGLDKFFTISGTEVKWDENAIVNWTTALVDKLSQINEISPEVQEHLKSLIVADVEAATAAERVSNAYTKMQSSLSSHSDYGGYTQITYEDYQTLIEADARYAEAIEYQNGVMTLNGAKHDEITAKILEENKAMALHEKQMILMSDEYQDLSKRFESGLLTDQTDLQRLLDLNVQIKGFDVLANEIDAATSAYYRWLNRKGDSGMDRFSQARDALDLINQTLNDKESEYYGRIGREDFALAVDFVLGEHVELNTPEFDRALGLAKKYLAEGANGAAAFYDDLVRAGLMDGLTGVMNSSIAEISQTLGISEEMVRTMIDRVNEYQDEASKIQVAKPEVEKEEAEADLADLIQSLEDAKSYIDEISSTPLVIGVEEKQGEAMGLQTVKETLESIKSNLTTIFQNPESFNLNDLSTVVQKIVGYLDEIRAAIEATNELGLEVDGENSTDALAALEAAAQEVTSSLTEISGLLSAIIASRNDLSTRGINIATGRSSSLLGTVSNSLSSIIDKLAQIKKNSSITLRISEVATKISKGAIWSGLSGLASASGNAAARGMAMATGGNTLVGELGMETVVDPATNTWYTVGERGAEFVRLPKDAIVFNHRQTEDLFGIGRIDSRGDAFASGNAALSLSPFLSLKGASTSSSSTSSAASKLVAAAVLGASSLDSAKGAGTFMNVSSSKKTSSGGGSSSSNENALETLRKQYEELNKQTEHLIAHQEFLYKQAKKGYDYTGMEQSLLNQAELYKKIMSDSQAGVAAMIAAGADDTNEELQAIEEAYWAAYDSLYDTLDQINALYVDALTEKIDNLQGAYENLKAAAEEFAAGGITVDTFQALIENGVQYLSLLDNVGGQYVINTEGIERMIAAQKEQLAIETALSYLQKIKTALNDNESNAIAALTDMTEALSNTTWDAVYAQAALLRGSGGLSEAQYAKIISNIDALKAISAAVDTSLETANKTQSEKNREQIDALEEILSLTEDLIKAEAKDKIEALEDEIDAYKKIIDLKKESLKTSKNENDYAKNVAEKTAEIAKMQARIDQLRLDDSRAARAERAKLEEELSDLQKDLGDLQSDHSYEQQENALDKAAEEFESARQKEIDALENSVSSAEKLYQAAIERLGSGWDTLYEELIAWNTEAGSSLNSEITENWLAAAEAVKRYGSYVKAVAALEQKEDNENADGSSSSTVVAVGTPTEIPAAPITPASSGNVSDTEATQNTQATDSAATETSSTAQPVQKVKVTNGRWNVRTGPSTSQKILGVVGNGTLLEYRGQTSGAWYAITYNGKDAWINNGCGKLIEETPKYHTGGVAGNEATLRDNEVLTVLEEGEMILTDKMKKAAYTLINFKDYLEQKLGNAIGAVPSPVAQIPALAGVGRIGGGTAGIGQVNFSPTIQVEINHSGAMTDEAARQYGKTIANTAMDELYEGFRQRGIGKIFGTKPTK